MDLVIDRVRLAELAAMPLARLVKGLTRRVKGRESFARRRRKGGGEHLYVPRHLEERRRASRSGRR